MSRSEAGGLRLSEPIRRGGGAGIRTEKLAALCSFTLDLESALVDFKNEREERSLKHAHLSLDLRPFTSSLARGQCTAKNTLLPSQVHRAQLAQDQGSDARCRRPTRE
jgi:hypothetical protein